jgi:hypothetical protein
MTWLAATEYVTNDHGYVSFVIITTSSFPHSWLITGFVTKVTRMMPHVEQELLILPGHMNSPPVFSVARSSVFFVMFCRCCLPFFFWSLYCLSFYLWLLITPLVSCGHCIVCLSIYGFWLPLWYLQTCLHRGALLWLTDLKI